MNYLSVHRQKVFKISILLVASLFIFACDNPRKFVGISIDRDANSITIFLDLCDKTDVVEFVELHDDGTSFGDSRGDRLLMRWDYPDTGPEYKLKWQGEYVPDLLLTVVKIGELPDPREDRFRVRDLQDSLIKIEADKRIYSETEFFARNSCESRGIFG